MTEKDLLYIEDMLNWNNLSIVKSKLLLDYLDDNKDREICNKVISFHSNQYKKLLNLLK